MATTKLIGSRARLDKLINYAKNKNKTLIKGLLDYTGNEIKTEHQLVSGINCTPETAVDEMVAVKELWGKLGGAVCYHAEQSFVPGEVDPRVAHEIGVKLATRIWGDRYQVVVATHTDKQHIHNHFALNSVSFIDGKKFRSSFADYNTMREASDELCREYGLDVISDTPPKYKSRHYAEWRAQKDGKPYWRGIVRSDMDAAIAQATTMQQFWSNLRALGYDIKSDVKYIAVKPYGAERYFRLYKLGDGYTEDDIRDRILQQQIPRTKPTYTYRPRKRIKINFLFSDLSSPIFKNSAIRGYRAQYFRMLYMLGLLPQKTVTARRPHYILREEIMKLNKYSEQVKLLCTYKIDTLEQLQAHRSQRLAEIDNLTAQRRPLYEQAKTATSDTEVSAIRQRIADINKMLKKVRKEVRTCADIEIKSASMKEKLKQIQQIEQEKQEAENRKEQEKDEPNRRRSD